MKELPEVVRLHHRTRPFWARLRRVLEERNPSNDGLKDVEIIDQAIHVALTVLDKDPAHADENSMMLSLDSPYYIIPQDESPEEKYVPIRPPPTAETLALMARLDELEAEVKILKEKNE